MFEAITGLADGCLHSTYAVGGGVLQVGLGDLMSNKVCDLGEHINHIPGTILNRGRIREDTLSRQVIPSECIVSTWGSGSKTARRPRNRRDVRRDSFSNGCVPSRPSKGVFAGKCSALCTAVNICMVIAV